DGACFKQGEVAFLVSRNLPEGLQGAIRRAVLLISHGNEILRVGQTGFLKRPTHTQVAYQALCQRWHPIECREPDSRAHLSAPCWLASSRRARPLVQPLVC